MTRRSFPSCPICKGKYWYMANYTDGSSSSATCVRCERQNKLMDGNVRQWAMQTRALHPEARGPWIHVSDTEQWLHYLRHSPDVRVWSIDGHTDDGWITVEAVTEGAIFRCSDEKLVNALVEVFATIGMLLHADVIERAHYLPEA